MRAHFVPHASYLALRAELAALRKSSGLSQVQLAQTLGVGQSCVSKIERGEMYADPLLFIDWCRACGNAPENVFAHLS